MIKFHGDMPDPYKNPEWWIHKSLTDLFWFCRVVLSHGKKEEYKDLNWIHLKLCDFIDMEKNPILQKLVVMFRDSLKSTIFRGLYIQWFCRKRYYNLPGKVGIFSGLYELAEDHLDRIENEILQNELLQAFFHPYLPHKKSDAASWNKDQIRYKGVEIDIGSPEKSLTGHHYEGIGNDNLVNEINSDSSDQRKKIIRRWQQQESLLIRNGWELLMETPWAVDDVSGMILDPNGKFDYSKLRRKPCLTFISNTGYAVFSCPARGKDNKPVFPAKADEEYLERKKRKQGTHIYSKLYDLQIVPEEDIEIHPSWIEHYEELPVNHIRNMVVDAAGTTSKQSSHTAISLVDWDEEGTMHINYAEKRKLTPLDVLDWILEVYEESEEEERPITFLGIEKEKYGIVLADLIEERCPDIVVTPIDIRGRSRDARIGRLIARYEAGRILSKKGLKDYEDEALGWHKGKNTGVDILDTIAYQLDIEYLPVKMPKFDAMEIQEDEFSRHIMTDLMPTDREMEIAKRF